MYGIYISTMYSFACIYIYTAACITFKYTYSYRVSPGTDEVIDCRDLKRWASLTSWIPKIHPSCGISDRSSIAFVCVVSTSVRQGLRACRQEGKDWTGKSDFALETENYLVFWTRSKAMSNQRAFFHVFPRYLWLSVASWLLNLSTIPVHPCASCCHLSCYPSTVYHPFSLASRLLSFDLHIFLFVVLGVSVLLWV